MPFDALSADVLQSIVEFVLPTSRGQSGAVLLQRTYRTRAGWFFRKLATVCHAVRAQVNACAVQCFNQELALDSDLGWDVTSPDATMRTDGAPIVMALLVLPRSQGHVCVMTSDRDWDTQTVSIYTPQGDLVRQLCRGAFNGSLAFGRDVLYLSSGSGVLRVHTLYRHIQMRSYRSDLMEHNRALAVETCGLALSGDTLFVVERVVRVAGTPPHEADAEPPPDPGSAVAAIDVGTFELKYRIGGGRLVRPFGVVASSRGDRLFVTNCGYDGRISVFARRPLRIHALDIEATRFVYSHAFASGCCDPTSRVDLDLAQAHGKLFVGAQVPEEQVVRPVPSRPVLSRPAPSRPVRLTARLGGRACGGAAGADRVPAAGPLA